MKRYSHSTAHFRFDLLRLPGLMVLWAEIDGNVLPLANLSMAPYCLYSVFFLFFFKLAKHTAVPIESSCRDSPVVFVGLIGFSLVGSV